mmetsp:Transcript_57840/g.179715  ORF Transcript_57840/g.179715 Transcript_57840/m.179715 type:complete len:302 (-) Transcript_57840:208-1113(-)
MFRQAAAPRPRGSHRLLRRHGRGRPALFAPWPARAGTLDPHGPLHRAPLFEGRLRRSVRGLEGGKPPGPTRPDGPARELLAHAADALPGARAAAAVLHAHQEVLLDAPELQNAHRPGRDVRHGLLWSRQENARNAERLRGCDLLHRRALVVDAALPRLGEFPSRQGDVDQGEGLQGLRDLGLLHLSGPCRGAPSDGVALRLLRGDVAAGRPELERLPAGLPAHSAEHPGLLLAVHAHLRALHGRRHGHLRGHHRHGPRDVHRGLLRGHAPVALVDQLDPIHLPLLLHLRLGHPVAGGRALR